MHSVDDWCVLTKTTVKPKPQTTFFDTVKDQLDAPLFAVTLKYHAPGSYDFGFIDKSKFTGELAYADVDDSQGFWQFTADGYSVGKGDAQKAPITGIAGESPSNRKSTRSGHLLTPLSRHRYHPRHAR